MRREFIQVQREKEEEMKLPFKEEEGDGDWLVTKGACVVQYNKNIMERHL